MEEVLCSCLTCGFELGCFKNSWNGIGTSHFSPVYAPVTYVNGFETTGDIHKSAAGSQVENCFVQDLACRKCKIILGMRCDSAPEGHRFKKDQLILKLAQMSVMSISSGQKAVISVQDKFALTLPGAKKLATPRRASTVQPSPRSQTPSISGRRSFHESMLPPATPSKSQQELEKFKTWAADAISKQKEDIKRIGGAVERIENGMKAFRDFMVEIRTEAITNRQIYPSQDDLSAVRDDINGVRDELASYQHAQQPRQQDMTIIREKLHGLRRDVDEGKKSAVSQQDFGILVKDMQKVYNKAAGLETLEEDIESLKNRLDAFEEATRIALLSRDDAHENAIAQDSLTIDPGIPSSIPIDLAEDTPSAFVDPREIGLRSSVEQDNPLLDFEPDGPSQANQSICDSEESIEPEKQQNKKSTSQLKRKRSQIEDVSDPQPSAKRSKRPTKKSSVRHKDAQPESNHATSPILIESDRSDDGNDVEPQPLLNPAVLELRKTSGRPRTSSLSNLPKETQPASRPRTASFSHTHDRTHTASPSMPAQITLSKRNDRNLDPLLNFKKRDSSGLLLTPSGKVDGRSLRAKWRRNKENEHPATPRTQEVIEEAAPLVAQNVNESMISNSSTSQSPQRALLIADHQPSETDTFQIVIPLKPNPITHTTPTTQLKTHPPEPAAVAVSVDYKPHQCTTCKKRYKHAGGLERHKALEHADAKTNADARAHINGHGNGKEEANAVEAAVEAEAQAEKEEARRRKMEDRERLVRLTLEREL